MKISGIQLFTFLFLFATLGAARSESCEIDAVKATPVCFGSNDGLPGYFGEWRLGEPSGIGIIIHNESEIYIGEINSGLPERKGVLLQKNGARYGTWKNGQLSKSQPLPSGYIRDQLNFIGSNLKNIKDAQQVIESLPISKQLIVGRLVDSPERTSADRHASQGDPRLFKEKTDLQKASETCKEIGVKEGTERFGKCVLIISR